MRFETQQDLDNEERVIKAFTKGTPYQKLGDHDIDYLIPDRAYVEVKCINSLSTTYDTQILSLIKLVKLQEASRKLPTFVVFAYTDKIMYINFNDIDGYIKHSGRKQRKGAANDREILVFIDKNKLKEI